jgi:hypothetical protein
MPVERWSADQKDQVRKLWCDERLSASQIGERMGASRNAMVSLIHRMGLDGSRGDDPSIIAARREQKLREDSQRQAARLAARQREKKDAPTRAKVSAPPKAANPSPLLMLNIPFSQRRSTQCSWIAGEPGADATCCGLDVVDGKAWCPHHYAMVYEPRALRLVASQQRRPNRATTRYGALRVA